MPAAIDLTGRRFVRLTVLALSAQRSGARRKPMWFCRCDCGAELTVIGDNLRSGCSKSCGCLDRETASARLKSHGQSQGGEHAREYRIWKGMKQRCLNASNPKHRTYGARGISVCDEWLHDFGRFFADMGPCPAGQSIERKDNNGPYSPDNCRWATPFDQSRNTRRNSLLTIGGETLCLTDWALRYGLTYERVKKRLCSGWSIEKALTTRLRVQ